MKPYIIDTTLRDGEQAPGVVFNIKDKVRIAKNLDNIGIEELEIGTPAMGDCEINDIKALTNRNFKFKTSAWCRSLKKDIDNALKCNVDGVNISFPVSDIHLSIIKKDWTWVYSQMHELITYAKDNFAQVAVGAQDACRATESNLMRFMEICTQHHVDRVRIADTVGIMNPLSVMSLIEKIIKRFPYIYLEFHAHNDFGMATANALVALQSGAKAVSATVNGLGERAGNAALEEIIMALKHSFNIETNYNTTYLKDLCNYVSKASRRNIHDSKPIIGNMALKHETGIHVNGILQNRKAYQPFLAKEIGDREKDFLFGKHSGKSSVKNLLQEAGTNIGNINIGRLLEMVKEHSSQLKRNLSCNEVLGLANMLLYGPSNKGTTFSGMLF